MNISFNDAVMMYVYLMDEADKTSCYDDDNFYPAECRIIAKTFLREIEKMLDI